MIILIIKVPERAATTWSSSKDQHLNQPNQTLHRSSESRHWNVNFHAESIFGHQQSEIISICLVNFRSIIYNKSGGNQKERRSWRKKLPELRRKMEWRRELK